MVATRWLESEFAYIKSLAGAGVDGISEARREVCGQVFTPSLNSVAWKSAAAGAVAGAVGARLTGKRKPLPIALGGMAGSLVGLGAAAVWTSRCFTASATRSAFRCVNAARDAHWLKENPIDYA